jgi:hypothetical protein
MPVPVAHPGRHQRDTWVDRVQERRILVRRPVVGNLQHVRPQPGRAVPFEQRVLLLCLGVAGKQDGHPPHPGPQDQRVVVGIGPGAAQTVRRAQRQKIELTIPVRPAGRGDTDRHARGGGGRQQGAPAGRRLGETRADDGGHRAPAKDTRHPSDVIRVQMADHPAPVT